MKSFKLLSVLSFLMAAQVSWAETPLIDDSQGIREGNKILSAELQTIKLDRKLEVITGQGIEHGSVMLDLTQKEATLLLFRKSNCPKDALCIAMVPAPYIVKLPIVKESLEPCGKHYVAELNLGGTDGGLQTLTVIDHTKNICKMITPDTEISYTTDGSNIAGQSMKTYSTFTAERLYERFY